MYRGKRFLAVIPARGGSKGVPGKNVRPLGGRPLLAYTIDQVGAVPEIDLAVVSSDDPIIRAEASDRGMRVIDRPAALATDGAPTEAALLHALQSLAEDGEPSFDYVVVLEPTSPLRKPQTISGCIRTIVDRGARSLVTVRETRENIGTIEEGCFRPLRPGAPRRRQDREPFFVESSTVYVCRVDHLKATGTLAADDWCAYTVSGTEAVDINTLEDFALAECLMRMRREGN